MTGLLLVLLHFFRRKLVVVALWLVAIAGIMVALARVAPQFAQHMVAMILQQTPMLERRELLLIVRLLLTLSPPALLETKVTARALMVVTMGTSQGKSVAPMEQQLVHQVQEFYVFVLASISCHNFLLTPYKNLLKRSELKLL